MAGCASQFITSRHSGRSDATIRNSEIVLRDSPIGNCASAIRGIAPRNDEWDFDFVGQHLADSSREHMRYAVNKNLDVASPVRATSSTSPQLIDPHVPDAFQRHDDGVLRFRLDRPHCRRTDQQVARKGIAIRRIKSKM
jgi:hypothetical protein